VTPRRRRRTALSFGLLSFVAVTVAVSCRDATQITVLIKTGEKCTDLSGVEIVVGADQAQTQARFEQRYTAAVTHECDGAGTIGTLVVTPGGGGGTIVVAAGVRVAGADAPDPETCATPEGAKSCIIARRSFSFISHSSLTLPIELDPRCLGNACDPASTCFKGACVSASVTCSGSDCGLAQENPGGSGSGNEAGSSDGAYDADLDGMSFEDVTDAGQDTMPMMDAQADSGGLDAAGYPKCPLQSNMPACQGDGTNGLASAGGCSAPHDTTKACCRCTCQSTGQVVGCDVFLSMATNSSCAPSMCSP
jgi:hypothetical protein